MNRIRTILALLFLAAAASIGTESGWAAARRSTRPNIVLVVADDLGYGDIGCYGCTDTKTPVLDRLAEQGVRFTQFYSNGPECSPTRTGLMTGRYQQRVGGLECAIGTGNVGRYDDAIRLAQQHDLGLPPEQNSLVGGLKRAGYAVAGFGKWHLGYEPKFLPLRHGFETYFGPIGGGVDYWYHCEWDGVPMLYENDKLVHREGYMTDLITDGAVEFLRNYHDQRPLLLYVPYTAPHTPIESPDEKPPAPRNEENWNQGSRQTYAAMVEWLDQGIGKILDAVENRGLTGRTLVIFFSDNGGTRTARNAPLSGFKGGLLEGGIRVPAIVRWPGVLPEGKTSDQVTISMDFTRSILRAAGAAEPKDRPLDGIDVLATLASAAPPIERTLFWRQRRGEKTWRAVRQGDIKYVSLIQGDRFEEHLYDLGADISEKNDLLPNRPDEAARLKRLLSDWEVDVRPGR